MEENFIKIQKSLYPLSFLYGLGVSLRNKMFDWGILRSKSYDIPVICIGNITVGGTGKTPHTEYLIKLLKKGFKVAVLSRGYKRKSKDFVLATLTSSAKEIGDEPYQIKQKFPEIAVSVDKDRCHGIETLCDNKKESELGVILLDDAFQHRYVNPGMSILLVDFNRQICDDALLPAGRLREPLSGKNRANIVIVTKCPRLMKPMDFRIITKRLDLYPYQQLYFTSYKYGNLTPIFPGSNIRKRTLAQIEKNENILLLTGIASPKQLLQDLERYSSHITPLTFADHHDFTEDDLKTLKETFDNLSGEKKIIITTEKDAARLTQFTNLDETIQKNIFALPIEVKFLLNQEDTFNQNIIEYVRKNKRNSKLSERENAY
ncbi:tetraacyldisaccharide 4'-kinase [uncultured Bacteroides sp.]|uniref:tetraacyldisaccharide 4'-kinase n=1 Tax=uncultured Bacteroides sp. TaxID=162156 RepID=UPI002AAB782C|nr:tetraacyldisaccharide 4'-kinase [uncultured Bacteroides sp.]